MTQDKLTTDGSQGLTVPTHAPREPDVSIDADRSLLQLHSTLLDAGLADAALAALAECPGDDDAERRAELRAAGVDALDGLVATRLASTRARLDSDRWLDAWASTLDLLHGLGSGHVDGVPSDRDDLLDAVPPLLAATSAPAATPTVSVRLGVGWASRRRQERVDVLRFLVALARGADVCLVATDAAAHRLDADHADLLPAHCLRQVRNRHRDTHDAVARETAADARADLDPNARPSGVVRALSRSPTHSLTYDRLASDLALDSPPYEAVSTAADAGLVERMERPDGTTVVSLRPAGDRYVDALAAADGGRASSSAWSSGGSAGVSDSPQISPSMPCYPSNRMGGTPDPDRDSDDARPPSEAATTADGDRTDRWQTGLVTPRWADRVDWVPAVGHADPGELALVDADLSDRLDDDRDGRSPLVGYDGETAYIGAEYYNPMQSAVAVAHGLTSDHLLDAVDLADRIGDDLDGLDISERPVLWSATCLGWLPSEVDDGEDYLNELTDARDDLLELSGLATIDDSEVSRSQVTRQALGLVGTMTALLDLAGVDVVLEERVVECARHYSEHGNADRRDDLLDHLRMLSALSSRVGAFSVFRQLHEDRAHHRSDAMTPTPGDGDTGLQGSQMAGIVVTGDGVEGLADDLRDDLDPRPVHSDAPPISVAVDVTTGPSRQRTGWVVREMLRSRGLRPTPGAVAVLSGVAADPWAAAEAVHWGLKSESRHVGRSVRLDECRRALATLDADRILPEQPRSARKGVAALLDADRPLSQRELADRAGISTQSWRNHRDGLVAADWVRETTEGWGGATASGWRVALPFDADDDADVAQPPWYLASETGHGDHPQYQKARSRRKTQVLDWLMARGYPEEGTAVEEAMRGVLVDQGDVVYKAGSDADPPDEWHYRALWGDVDPDHVDDILRDWGLPADLLLAGCLKSEWGPSSTATASLGRATRQQSLPI